MPVHPASTRGYPRGARDYVSGRPGYPPETVDWLKQTLKIGPGSRVLELGAGTGKFLPVLEAAGGEMIALEPVDAMREQLTGAFPHIEVLAGSSDRIPLADGAVDAVICAQAFHWFATPAALAEIHRVLAPGGMLGLIWNGRDESVEWVAELSEITNRYEGDTPRYRTGAWRDAFPARGFRFVDERHVRNTHLGSVEDVVVRRTLSVSFIAALPDEARREAEAEVRALIARRPELDAGGDIGFPYETSMYAYARVSDEGPA